MTQKNGRKKRRLFESRTKISKRRLKMVKKQRLLRVPGVVLVIVAVVVIVVIIIDNYACGWHSRKKNADVLGTLTLFFILEHQP